MAGMEGFYQRDEGAARRMTPLGVGVGGHAPAAPQPPQYVDSPGRGPQLHFPSQNPPALMVGKGQLGRSRQQQQQAKTPSVTAPAGLNGSGHDRYAGLGFGVAGLLTDYLASHPFLVLRRQCQVNSASLRRHRTPFTLLPVVANLNRSQGLGCLWKGLGSALTVRGLTLAAEDLASKFTPWPKEVDRRSSLRMVGQHLMLKAVSAAAVTPFYSASLVETVQSEIASERPGIFDVFREGFGRVLNWGVPHSGRMLPVWLLIPPTVAHAVAHYSVFVVASSLAHAAVVRTHRSREASKGAVAKETCVLPGLAQYQEQLAHLLGHLAADVLLYPLETILHRLHMQGCRTIVDNLDTGREVIPIMTRYEGFFDCLSTVLEEEGAAGLFRGFGALVLQYCVQFAVIAGAAAVVGEVARIGRDQTGPPPAELAEYAAAQQQQQQQVRPQQQQPYPTPPPPSSFPRTVSSDDVVGSRNYYPSPGAAASSGGLGDREDSFSSSLRSSHSTPTAAGPFRRKIFPTDYEQGAAE